VHEVVNYILCILPYSIGVLIGIDFFMYLIFSPEVERGLVGLLLSGFAFSELIIISCTKKNSRLRKKMLTTQLSGIFVYMITAQLIMNVSHSRDIALWYETNVKLNNIESIIISTYQSENNIPASLQDVCNAKCREDPYRPGSDFMYKKVKNNEMIIYSVGPDGIDNMGTLVLDQNAIKYSPHAAPWKLMPFRTYIISMSGFDDKLKGDIARVIRSNDIVPR